VVFGGIVRVKTDYKIQRKNILIKLVHVLTLYVFEFVFIGKHI